jgi:DNA adenine methylase
MLKTPVSYYGGKQKMLPHILPLIPPHINYTEAFCGGAAVFFAKPPARFEVLNDLNGALVAFYRCMKLRFEELDALIQATLHSRSTHAKAWAIYSEVEQLSAYDLSPEKELELAWALWVVSSQSFAGVLRTWGYGCDNHMIPKGIKNKKKGFGKLAERFNSTTIECRDALWVLERYDNAEAFHYIDPPYIGSDCGHYKGYTETDFAALIELLTKLKGRFLLSSYPNEMLNEVAKEQGWIQKEIVMQLNVNGNTGKNQNRKKTEMLTMNYDPFQVCGPEKLFS